MEFSLLPARDRLKNFFDGSPVLAKKSLGQNFLVSDRVIEAILRSVSEMRHQSIIEIGPGPGALTDGLRQISKDIVLIELDHQFAHHWRENQVNVIEDDALKIDWSQFKNSGSSILVSNLPYQISSSLVVDRSVFKNGPDQMVLMFQKEVAQRMRASCSTSAYGLLSVIAQTFWNIETVIDAGPGDFKPPPKVASRVLKFSRKTAPMEDSERFLQFCKAAFAQRRKLLAKNIHSWLGRFHKTPLHLAEWLESQQHNPQARAEELSPSEFVELYMWLCKN